jgi:hypothetical protein
MMAHSFRDATHLPNNRGGRPPASPEGLPRQRRGVSPQDHGRYPDYDVMEHARQWDHVTREVLVARVRDVPPVRFFDPVEATCLRAFCDVVMAQDREPRVPVFELVDAKLHDGKLDGFQHVGMPDDRDTWRIVARGLDEAARGGGAECFAGAGDKLRRAIVGRFATGELEGGAWDELASVATAWSVVMRAVLSEFYSHPWAFNEIGFGGPRYPRGYMRQGAGLGGTDPDEAVEAFGLDPVSDVRERGLE